VAAPVAAVDWPGPTVAAWPDPAAAWPGPAAAPGLAVPIWPATAPVVAWPDPAGAGWPGPAAAVVASLDPVAGA
jgi:hypothetical protein